MLYRAQRAERAPIAPVALVARIVPVVALAELDAKRVIIVDNMSAAYGWNIPSLPNITFVQGCITDEVTLKRVFNLKPDVVYHLAAFFANQNSVDYPALDLHTNGMGTLLMMQYAQMCGVDRFVYASSGCSIYGAAAPLPLSGSS